MINEMLKPGVLLTTRDYSILEDLYHYTVMSFLKIKDKHFQNVGKATAINRLSKLELAGFILRKRLPRFIQSGTDLQVSVVYQITKDGIKELQKRHSFEVFKHEPIILSPLSIDHDLLLNDVMDTLSEKLKPDKILNGKLIDKEKHTNGINPDAVCFCGDERIAIELELSLKSEQRYRDLILKYRLAHDFKKVIYVTAFHSIQAKLIEVISHKQLPNAPKVFTDKFYFVDLKELLGGLVHSAISNGKDNILKSEV